MKHGLISRARTIGETSRRTSPRSWARRKIAPAIVAPCECAFASSSRTAVQERAPQKSRERKAGLSAACPARSVAKSLRTSNTGGYPLRLVPARAPRGHTLCP